MKFPDFSLIFSKKFHFPWLSLIWKSYFEIPWFFLIFPDAGHPEGSFESRILLELPELKSSRACDLWLAWTQL